MTSQFYHTPVLSPQFLQHVVTLKFLQQVATGSSILLQVVTLSILPQVALFKCVHTIHVHYTRQPAAYRTSSIHFSVQLIVGSGQPWLRQQGHGLSWQICLLFGVVVNFKFYLFISPITLFLNHLAAHWTPPHWISQRPPEHKRTLPSHQ